MQKTQDELMQLEKGFWENMDSPDFYSENFARDGLAVINGDLKTQPDAVAMTREMPMKFENIRYQSPRFVQISDDVAAVTYEASAQNGDQKYAATITSVYANRGGKWLLVLTTHSQPADTGAQNGKRKQKEPATANSR
jgi:hypothetical protein